MNILIANRRIRCSTGFSLIELMVVIAIIAILSALLVPVVVSARGKGQQAVCANNVRQILIARKMYAGDNQGNTIPNRPVWPDDPKGVCTWRWLLTTQYAVDPKSFMCRSAPNAYSEIMLNASYATGRSDVPSNYTQIETVFGNDSQPRRLSIIPELSKQIEIIEFRDYWPDMTMDTWGWVWADGYGIYGFWHNGRTVMGYADGHVEVKMLYRTVTPNCEWDTPAGPHDGKFHPHYNYMLDHYKIEQ